jgi:spermidine/putrescine transport system ATP-binding protein
LCDNPNLLPKLSKKDEEHEFVIRPEDIDIVNPNDGIILGRVESVAYHGLMYEIIVKSQNHTISINTTDKTVVGKNVGLR